jgi:ubiquinone/menaquinone biosynthesis C-methylase UbiE
MIAGIIETLHREKLLSEGTAVAWNVVFGRSTNIQLFVDQRLAYNVKVSEKNLAAEYGALAQARKALGEHAPEPLLLTDSNHANILVCRGISSFSTHAIDRKTLDFLNLYMRSASEHFSAPGTGENLVASVRAIARKYANETGILGLEKLIGDRQYAILRGLKPVKQHGDLGAGNLRWAGSRLVLFDWEDFGIITVPGFDLYLLISSLHGFSVKRSNSWFERNRTHIGRLVCETVGIELPEFLALGPLYLMLFFHLKYELGYGQSIVDVVRSELLAAEAEVESAAQLSPNSGDAFRDDGTPASKNGYEAVKTSYRESHLECGGHYDQAISDDPFSAYMDRRESVLLTAFIQAEFHGEIPNYLDFACGTGRISARVEPFARQAWGVDVSQSMLQSAAQRLTKTTLIRGDLTRENIDLPPMDLVTAFRFFGNAEDEFRREALTALNRVLRPGGWLVLNNHRNPHALSNMLFRLTGGQHEMDLTMPRMQALLAEHGFSVRLMVPIGAWLFRDALVRQDVLASSWADRLEAMTRLSLLAGIAPDIFIAAQKTS